MPDQPKRFKTVLSFRCVQGHINLYDHRIRASSPEEAQKISFEYVRQEAKESWFAGFEEGRKYPLKESN